jgi:hypothetical protein
MGVHAGLRTPPCSARGEGAGLRVLTFLGVQIQSIAKQWISWKRFISYNVSAAAARRTFEKEHGRRVDGSTLLLAVSFKPE